MYESYVLNENAPKSISCKGKINILQNITSLNSLEKELIFGDNKCIVFFYFVLFFFLYLLIILSPINIFPVCTYYCNL